MSTNISEDATYWVASTSSLKDVPEKFKLNILEFSRGVRSNEVNENFDLIRYWIEAERLRIGGWGIVEGFELTKDLTTYSVDVGPGIIINQHGEELHVDGTKLASDIIEDWKDQIEGAGTESLKIDDNGVLTLRFAMYSSSNRRTITYAPPVEEMSGIETEFRITLKESGQVIKLDRDIQSILENKLLIPQYAGQEVIAEYMYLNDRIDGIFLRKDGEDYQYEKGIISTSPSNQTVQDYFERGYYLIGFAYWHVGSEIDVEFFCGDRTYRPVYVDRNNILYLNGEPYKKKTVIYFVEPDPPVENDLWYCLEDEILYIWRPDENGVFGWQPVNDLSRSIVSVHQFSIAENPDDLQTFSFRAYPELAFIPKMHQLTIIVDQVVIMEDQYEELYPEDGEGYACGTGFRFKHPLERPSIVEVRVTHNVNASRKRADLFPHESFYGDGAWFTIGTTVQTIFPVNCQYQCFANQIEVFKNGIRLLEGRDFNGILKGTDTVATTLQTNQECDRFKLTSTPSQNDIISYRILRPIVSYTNLRSIVAQYEATAQECLNRTDTVSERVDTLSNNLSTIQRDYGTTLTAHTSQITELQRRKMNVDALLGANNLASDIRDGVISGKAKFERQANSPTVFVTGLSVFDYLTIGYKPANGDTILLIEDQDYTVTGTADGIRINLISRWTGDATAKLYITALKIGV